MTFPDDCRYTKDHEWVRMGDDGLATIGITDYAQQELGDIVYVEMPDEGDHFDAEEVFGTVEAVKTVSELFAPVAGTVEAINEELDGDAELVNRDPYGEGWFIKLRPDSDDLSELMDAAAYKHLIGADA